MGIYGALSTAVTGLQAQSFALQNISGNIANSQTVGYKRVETSFEDLMPDAAPTAQPAGSVVAESRATNNITGDISTSSDPTNMAINGPGFFLVQQQSGTSDGSATFSGATYYTRRGDFDLDKSGYLVNGAGYYLEGLPIDPSTGNVSGSVPSVIQISNALLPALASTQINYQVNLPNTPSVESGQADAPGSELLNPNDFSTATGLTGAVATGTTTVDGTAAATTVASAGQSLTLNINGTQTTFDFYDSTAGAYTGGNTGIDISGAATVQDVLDQIQTTLQSATGANIPTATASIVGGKVQISLGSDTNDSMTVADTTSGSAGGLGLDGQTDMPTGAVSTIDGADGDTFVSESIEGGAVTVYGPNGAPANVQFRWAKTDSADLGPGHTDSWGLYYMTNSSATGTDPMWQSTGTTYKFASDGSLDPAVTSTTINNLTVNGLSLGNITLQHGKGGVTQSYTDTSGTASVTNLTQNGYAAGKFNSVAIDDSGRVVASYSNGQQVDVAQVVTANFNGADALKRMDGGAFEATTDSGPPILENNPSISGSSLEASNVDISSEFSTLIVTQQAYAAGTKIVSTANSMLQQALDMVR